MITRKKFIQGSFRSRTHTKENHPIVLLLKTKKHIAFTVKDMGRITKMKSDTIRSMLRVLIKKRLVEHKAPYFMWK